MTQHTPGPWEARAGSQWRVFPASKARAIATISTVDMAQEANARLIAAAPDGLAANKMALAYIADELTETSRDEDPDAWAIVDALRAAIAKATGEA